MESWDPIKQISQCLGRGSLLRAQTPVPHPRMLDSWASSACLRVAHAASAGVLILLSLLSFCPSEFLCTGREAQQRVSVSKSFFALLSAVVCHWLPSVTFLSLQGLGVGT